MAVDLTIVGSGDAFNSDGCGNACQLLQDAVGALCVDFGPSALMGLRLHTDIAPSDVDMVVITHLHGDHFGGLHLLMVDADFPSHRTKPLVICGPTGIGRVVEDWYRLAFGPVPAARSYRLEFHEFQPGDSKTILGRRITAFAATHMGEGDQPLSFRIETAKGEAVVAFSGDTTWNDGLKELSSGADLFVCDCSCLEGPSPQHLTWKDLESHLDVLDARKLVVSHIGPSVRKAREQIQSTGVTMASDGLRLRVKD